MAHPAANYVVLAARGIDQRTVLGQRTPNRVKAELRDGFHAQYWNENRPNRSDRLITARRSRVFPLIFTVGISEQEIYSRSALRQRIYLVGALLLTFIILTATMFHWRRTGNPSTSSTTRRPPACSSVIA